MKKNLTAKIVTYSNFWVAEERHQDFAHNNIQNDYVQKVIKPYIRGVEKKYGAWMLRVKSIFPVSQDAKN